MNILLFLWFLSVAISLLYVVVDLTKTPISWVQKLAWILVTAYVGPFALFAYYFSCHTRKRTTHTESTNKNWQQAINSEMHCLAGDATGIIVAAAIVYHFGFPNGLDLVVEYLSAFIFGLFIFQALMMKNMYQGNYGLAVRKTFFAETVSMNTVMLGMIPVMVILMFYIKNSDNPWDLSFWFVMGMATLAGGITAFPINYWLVIRNLKHGCMTIPSKETMESMTAHHHPLAELSMIQKVFWVIGTFLLLVCVVLIIAQFFPVAFYM